jgi:transcriptional regulator GlxA family with amidase domain
MRAFLRTPCFASAASSPPWIEDVHRRLRVAPSVRINALANEIGLHPSWLGGAFKRATGESVLEYATRLRVERAAQLLRETSQACAEIALDAGFCDQSHMNRSFQRLLQRSPTQVRDDRKTFRQNDSLQARADVLAGLRTSRS